MRKRKDWAEFIDHIGYGKDKTIPDREYDEYVNIVYVLDTTGLLLQEAVEFMRRGYDYRHE